ncbi:MAG: hypothetical protein FWH48_10800 [Oscillospiraceae bacterium]|nr:hypothetical protein [Oscillospiraceae bacterium]
MKNTSKAIPILLMALILLLAMPFIGSCTKEEDDKETTNEPSGTSISNQETEGTPDPTKQEESPNEWGKLIADEGSVLIKFVFYTDGAPANFLIDFRNDAGNRGGFDHNNIMIQTDDKGEAIVPVSGIGVNGAQYDLDDGAEFGGIQIYETGGDLGSSAPPYNPLFTFTMIDGVISISGQSPVSVGELDEATNTITITYGE